MGRIEDRLGSLKKERKKALVFFVTAGFPQRDSTERIAAALENGGADILEIGMPFSDPLADGPVIQHSSAVALRNGVTLDFIFDTAKTIRSHSGIPLVLMGYLSPILEYGVKKFFTKASASGVDGIILPEIPLEEIDRFKSIIEQNSLSQILLVTPTTSADRIRRIDALSRGFLYCVSTTGVTGNKRRSQTDNYFQRVRENATQNPLLVGFGISTPADAAAIARSADGVIVGSALIQRLEQYQSAAELSRWAREFKTAIL